MMIKRKRNGRRVETSPMSDSACDYDEFEGFNKRGQHERSKHKEKEDFLLLSKHFGFLKKHMILNLKWKPPMPHYMMYHYNFNHPDAVYHLSKAILKNSYNLNLVLPCACPGACDDCDDGPQAVDRFLAPCIPNRADYIHNLADLLQVSNNIPEDLQQSVLVEEGAQFLHRIAQGKDVVILDIGTGANVIYPLLGNAEYKWRFVATDINPASLECARLNVELNGLSDEIILRRQRNHLSMFCGVMQSDERCMASMCNPPFHYSVEQTNVNPKACTMGRREEMIFVHPNVSVVYQAQYIDDIADADGSSYSGRQQQQHTSVNYSSRHAHGQGNELLQTDRHLYRHPRITGQVSYTFSSNVAEHGELAFIEIMLQESRLYAHNIVWFTSLVARASTLKSIKNAIHTQMRMYQNDNQNQVAFIDAAIGLSHGEGQIPSIDVGDVHICQARFLLLGKRKLARWLVCWTFMNPRQCFHALFLNGGNSQCH